MQTQSILMMFRLLVANWSAYGIQNPVSFVRLRICHRAIMILQLEAATYTHPLDYGKP